MNIKNIASKYFLKRFSQYIIVGTSFLVITTLATPVNLVNALHRGPNQALAQEDTSFIDTGEQQQEDTPRISEEPQSYDTQSDSGSGYEPTYDQNPSSGEPADTGTTFIDPGEQPQEEPNGTTYIDPGAQPQEEATGTTFIDPGEQPQEEPNGTTYIDPVIEQQPHPQPEAGPEPQISQPVTSTQPSGDSVQQPSGQQPSQPERSGTRQTETVVERIVERAPSQSTTTVNDNRSFSDSHNRSDDHSVIDDHSRVDSHNISDSHNDSHNKTDSHNVTTSDSHNISITREPVSFVTPQEVRVVTAQVVTREVTQPKVVLVAGSTTSELPKTGVPLAGIVLGMIAPIGMRLKRFGKLSKDTITANIIWEEREFQKSA